MRMKKTLVTVALVLSMILGIFLVSSQQVYAGGEWDGFWNVKLGTGEELSLFKIQSLSSSIEKGYVRLSFTTMVVYDFRNVTATSTKFNADVYMGNTKVGNTSLNMQADNKSFVGTLNINSVYESYNGWIYGNFGYKDPVYPPTPTPTPTPTPSNQWDAFWNAKLATNEQLTLFKIQSQSTTDVKGYVRLSTATMVVYDFKNITASSTNFTADIYMGNTKVGNTSLTMQSDNKSFTGTISVNSIYDRYSGSVSGVK